MTDLIRLRANAAEPSLPAPADLDALARRAAAYARATSTETTRKAYARDWIDFAHWCRSMNLDPLPASPATVGTYLTEVGQFAALRQELKRVI